MKKYGCEIFGKERETCMKALEKKRRRKRDLAMKKKERKKLYVEERELLEKKEGSYGVLEACGKERKRLLNV